MGKVLIAYATKLGTAADAARRVAAAFREAGREVDMLPADEATDLSGYESVVLGTAIRVGKPVAEAKHFVQKHGKDLVGIRTALFSIGLTMAEDTPENREKALSFLTPLVESMRPVSVGVFPGRVDMERLPLIWRMFFSKELKKEDSEMARAMRLPLSWEPLEAWAREVAEKL